MGKLFKLKTEFLVIYIQTFLLINAEDLRQIIEESSSLQPSTRLRNTVTLDLAECTCISSVEACDLTIIKSPILEMNCINGENLCCPIIQSSKSNHSKSDDSNSEMSNPASASEEVPDSSKSNVRVFSITPYFKNNSTENAEPGSSTRPKPKNCHCKARSSCPHKYIDYGFGFYCTYNTVRCCIPEELHGENNVTLTSTTAITEDSQLGTSQDESISITEDTNGIHDNASQLATTSDVQNELAEKNETSHDLDFGISNGTEKLEDDQQTQGELLITEVTNLWKPEDFQKEIDCLCLPVYKCRVANSIDSNQIERRRDTMCPSDLIQCCGTDVLEEITKKKDDSEFEITAIQQDYPPYKQPVQLPNSLLPDGNEMETELGHDVPQLQAATLPAPVLPTQYHSFEPTSYHRGNTPTNSYPTQFSGPQNYQKGTYGNNGQNIRPWVSLSSPSSYSKYPVAASNDHPGFPRGPYRDESRASKPGGLFNTLAQMLG